MKRRIATLASLGLALGVALGACEPPQRARPTTPTWVTSTGGFAPGMAARPSLAARYGAVTAKIIAAARADRGAYAKLAELTDTIGHRLSGSPQLTRAIAWAAAAMTADGHPVRTEAVMVPHWVRGVESAAIVMPATATVPRAERALHVLGLGGSVSTPAGGLTAPLVVVASWDELEAKAASVKGAIVLFDVPLPRWDAERGFSGYSGVAPYRVRGPSRAAKLGAVAVLMRSVTATSLSTPHTGTLVYADDQPKIPAAAITVEDASLLGRLTTRGPVTLRLQLESKQLPEAPSANVIGELVGRERPEEIVVIGAHLDSWDVGQGAHDDGAGCVIMMQALTTLRRLGLQPRRTIRVVLFTNEENGGRGAKGYAAQHADEIPRTVLAVESDSGGFAPRGFSVELAQGAEPALIARTLARVTAIGDLLRTVAPMRVTAGGSGSDIGPLVAGGVPGIGLIVDSATYFDLHHTEADTLDKVDPVALAESQAAIAVLAFVVADMPARLLDATE